MLWISCDAPEDRDFKIDSAIHVDSVQTMLVDSVFSF